MIDRADRVLSRISAWMGTAAAVVIMTLMLAISLEVASRLLRGQSVTGLYELVQALVALAVFLAIAKAERDGAHVRVELATSRMPMHWARAARRVGNFVSTLVIGLIAYATTQRAISSVHIGEFTQGHVSFSIWPVRIVVAAGLVMLMLELAIKTFGKAETGERQASDLNVG